MPTPSALPDVEPQPVDRGRRPSWWRRLIAGAGRVGQRGLRRIRENRAARQQRAGR